MSAHKTVVDHVNGDTRHYAMWRARCKACPFVVQWLPTRADARIAAAEHREWHERNSPDSEASTS